jgi:predicted nucleic acid-binding protein
VSCARKLRAASLATPVDAVHQGVIRLADDEELVATALPLALDIGHKVPDCVYLTLPEREDCSLSTGDRRLAQLARSRRIGVGAAAR